MKIGILLMFTILSTLVYGQTQQFLKNGDLIFVADNQSAFAQSINKATNEEQGNNYNHVALIQISNNDTFVWHATTKYGVVKQSFDTFQLLHANAKLDIYGINELSYINDDSINQLFSTAAKHLGKGYNYSFIPNDSSVYCSEFVLEMMGDFLNYRLIPMNFKDLKTGAMPSFWIDYYKKLGIEIPQGVLGSNPNDLSKNAKVQYKFTLRR